MIIERFRKIQLKGLLLGIFSFCFITANGHAQKVHFSIFGGRNHVFEYGSEDDYVMSENDFPVTPAHAPFNFGMALVVFFTNNIGVELDGRYVFSSKVILQDPSDQDTVEIDTAKHYAITLNFVYRFLSSRFRPYLLVGGGIDKLLAKYETYTTEYGYDIEVLAPEKTTDVIASLGTGVQFFILTNLGARLDVRYSIIFDDPDNQINLNVTLGLFFGFDI